MIDEVSKLLSRVRCAYSRSRGWDFLVSGHQCLLKLGERFNCDVFVGEQSKRSPRPNYCGRSPYSHPHTYLTILLRSELGR